jgi:alkylation response protein AidB-like acyl-CoA dehydrogenase
MVSPDLVRALDRDEIQYPREFLEKLAKHNLLGLRIDPRWGRRGGEEIEAEKIYSDEDPG